MERVKPTKKELKECKLKTITYRGISVDIFIDDYGQSYYCYFDNECISFGTYNFNYEEDVKYLIDKKLDGVRKNDRSKKKR